MSRVKMFFIGEVGDKVKMYNANFESKKSSGLAYAFKSSNLNSLVKKIRSCAYEVIAPLKAEGYFSEEPLAFEDRFKGKQINLKVGSIWAKNTFDCMWIHCTGELPSNCDIEKVRFLVDIGGEGLVVDKDGKIAQGITNYASEFSYDLGRPAKKIILNKNFIQNGKVEFWIDAAANDLFGKFQENAIIRHMEIVLENVETRLLAYDLEVLLSAYNYADKCLADEYLKVFKQLRKKCKFPITEEIAVECREILKPLFGLTNKDNVFEYTAVGHAHLDLAWLWPLRESYRKGLRTFSTQVMNMDRYDDYYFGASQAQLFDWVKSLDSDLYARVKEKVESGKLEVQGATWVEMDSNLVSLESLIRQFYYGKKYFLKEFGLDMKILWLPDSFGYSSCLPQIMKLSNVPYFLTQKLSWNTVTKFPYHTFNWVGLDGSRVFAHMLPDNTYNGPNRADYLMFGAKNYQEKNICNKALCLFGIGDGGAGPGFEHIERGERLANLAPLPKLKMGKAVDFFDDLVKEREIFDDYQGELYLEKHQGTYTTRALNKWYNRKCEFAFRNYELLVCMLDGKFTPIPLDELEIMWKEVLLYQFHDILPGSSINRVYDECVPRYKIILDKLNGAIADLLSKVGSGVNFFNPNSYDMSHYFHYGNKWFCLTVPKMSVAQLADGEIVNDLVVANKNSIENENIKITFKNGLITGYFDKKLNREFVAYNGSFCQYSVYNDFGDCWDMRKNYKISKRNLRCKQFKIENDGVKAVAQSVFVCNGLVVTEEIVLLGNEDFAKVNVHIKNNRERSMLRVAFNTQIESDKCAFNTQCGHIYRSTKEITKTEKAQYEVSGQKFVDLSCEDCGIAIINDCKYGFRCKGSTIDMNLLRSPNNPGKHVDQGDFDLQFAIYTHGKGVSDEVYKRAYAINNPIVDYVGDGNESLDKVFVDNQNVVVESVKVADNSGIVIRLYNSSEEEQKFNIKMDSYCNMEIVNILEDRLDSFDGNGILKAFEIVNIRFYN